LICYRIHRFNEIGNCRARDAKAANAADAAAYLLRRKTGHWLELNHASLYPRQQCAAYVVAQLAQIGKRKQRAGLRVVFANDRCVISEAGGAVWWHNLFAVLAS
jgi:hypothetical protein